MKKPVFCAILPYPPSVNHYYGWNTRTVPPIRYIGKKGKLHRLETARALIEQNMANIQFKKRDSVTLKISIHAPDNRRRDVDNILKCTLDSLQCNGILEDDNIVSVLHVYRSSPSKENPRIFVTIRHNDR